MRAQTLTQNMALAVDQSLSNSISKIDLALRAVADELERELANGRLDKPAVDAILERYQQRLPEVEAIRIANAEGLVVFGKGLDPAARASWADREYFTYLRDHPEGGLQISKPRVGRVAKKYIVGFARRYNFPDGRFAGVISAPVAVDYFSVLLSQFNVGKKGIIVLRDNDLGLITRHPAIPLHPAGAVGNTAVSKELRAIVDSEVSAATYHTLAGADQMERTNSLRRIASAPMIVVAGMASDEYLAGWHTELYKTLAVLAGFIVFTLAAAGFVLHLLRRIVAEGQRNELYLHHASDGTHILDDQGNVVQASDRFCAMLGYGRDEIIGMNVSRWDRGWSADALIGKVLPDLLGTQTATTLETRHCSKDGGIIDVEVSVVGVEMEGRRYLFCASRDISERKRQQQILQESEARLRQSEERYRLLLQHSPIGILHYGLDLVVTYANGRFEEIMKLPAGRGLGIDCKTLQDQSVVPALREAIQGRHGKYEGPYTTTHGGVVLWISMACAPLMDQDGAILGGIAIIEDITERELAHQKLVESEARLQAIIDNEPECVKTVAANGELLQMNRAGLDMLEARSIDDVNATGLYNFIAPEHRAAFVESVQHVFEGKTGVLQFMVDGKLGTRRWLDAHSTPLRDKDGKIIALLAVTRDITRQKQAESQLRLAARVFSHAHEGLMIFDAQRIVIDVNPMFSTISGYERNDVVGRPLRFNGNEEDSGFMGALWQAVELHGYWKGEVINRRKDGGTYTELLSVSEVRDENGYLTNYIGAFSDISALKEQQAQLEHLAHHDALTHLPNRALLSDRMGQALAQARRAGTLVAVGYLDLDGFKAINDELGHDAGDTLLIEVARRLRDAVRSGDTVARLGGDEFVLLLVGISSIEECELAATRVLRTLAAAFQLKGLERQISGSLGLTLFPRDDADPDTLLRHADQAMYLAKQGGKNRYQFAPTI
ncbi:MAG: sensor domain-containing diguanylate cyclase [Rhodocyclaceae bacterium]|nr:sensor domain-containing diguanylate cyclase [Rhodocyclaceae bacterium]